MPAVNSTVLRSMGEAAAASSRLIEKCVDHAVAELQAAETQATQVDQRQHLADAWRELLARRRGWTSRFPQLLSAAFHAEASGSAGADPLPTPSGFAALSLVDDTEISRKIESSRLTQQLTSMLERPLAELDALMSTALGLDGIQPERNPLRPVVYAQTLRKMMGEDDTDATWPGLWLRHMARPMAKELEQLYREHAQILTQAHVQAAAYRLVSAPSRPAGSAPNDAARAPAGAGGFHHGGGSPGPSSGQVTSPGPTGTGGTGGSAGAPVAQAAHMPSRGGRHAPGSTPAESLDSGFAALAAEPIPGATLQQFLRNAEPRADRALGPSYYEEIDRELRALQAEQDVEPYDARAVQQYMHMPPVERPQRRVDTSSPLPPQVWGQYSASRERSLVRTRLKKEARQAGQVFGLEVVRALVNQVADDPRLLGPVREAIVGLEPSLLRLAMVSPRFLSDENHPGRLLVERVAERSFKYNDEFSVEFQGFFVPVGQHFNRLNQIEKFSDAEPFRAALDSLQAGWAALDTLDVESQQKVLDAVQAAERRQQLADTIAGELRQREDLADAPQAVQDFLLGTWSLVVAHARLTQPRAGIDPGGHVAVVTDLLWSVDRGKTLNDPARAFELIPRVLLKLREGLTMLGQQAAESEAFFHQLEVLHRPVLKLRARHRHGHLAPTEPLRVVVGAGDGRKPAPAVWMAPEELRTAGFEDTVPSDHAPLQATDAPGGSSAEQLDPESVIASLAKGCWVDLHSHQHWRRARLMWASDRGTLFMFVSHGGQPHSMTRRTLERLMRDRLLRVVEGDGVVPRALERMARQPANVAVPA